MRIGIDARCLEWDMGGAGRILMNMLNLWPQITNNHHFVLYFHMKIPQYDFLDNPIFECKIIKGPKFLRKRQLFSGQVFMPIDIARDRLDLFYAPYYSAPLICKCPKTVVAAWDISYTTHKNQYPLKDRIRLAFFSEKSCKRSAGVITCSPFDARQIEKYYGIPAQRICTLQLAVEDKFKPINDPKRIDNLRHKYNLPKRYLLSMGVMLYRRNVDIIIEAFKSIYRDYPNIGLVVLGRNKTNIDIEGKMKPLISEGRGVYLSRATEDELVEFYNGALYYICTSTVDGEALMLKEAMKCGTPVITSTLLEETVGGTALIIKEPTSVTETAKVLREAFSSHTLREEYAIKGLKWVQQLSWYKVAQETIEFFESR